MEGAPKGSEESWFPPHSHHVAQPPPSTGISPATMRVKSKPFFTDFRWTWLGRVAKPTYCFSWSCRAEVDGSRSECVTPSASASHPDREWDSKSPWGRAKGWRRGRSLPWQQWHTPPLGLGTWPFPWVGTKGHVPATALLGYTPSSFPAQTAQEKRHIPPFPPESTSRAAADSQPPELLHLHSHRRPSQQGHQVPPPPQVISTSFPQEACVLHNGELCN